ncbi:hypothetical protein PYW07_009303 [Mythimna separata]|uniref:Peptidase S1 domain-containing protein n=1 Tax=Mythimna separata TaxID=271217 RepID=A0AAD7YBB5_MYTSE|nr:hypothetical protein PYW07_009303 [Mythimna separata]
MYSIKNIILYFIVLITVIQVQSLVELREEDKDLAITEAAIRKTVNSIFSILKLDLVKDKARFGEFAAIHNFFVTITFEDDDNLKEIAKLARVDSIDNNTQHFITQFNEVLNEDNKSHEPTEDEYVTAHIDTFIRKLEYLKFKYGFATNDAKFGINTQVLNHLADPLQNITNATQGRKSTDVNLLNDDEFWIPSASRRIFEGRRETIKRFPFMASIQFFKKFQCGGSIIKSDLVITSASCLQLAWNNRFFRENPAFLSVQVGSDLYEGGDENIPILEVYFYPEYNPKNLRNNLAIMRLVRILKFGKRVSKIKKIDFDRNPQALPEYTPGITIIGWGARHTSNIVLNIWKNRLAYSVLDFYPLRECQEVYSKEYVTRTNFCAGFLSKGGGACNRDAGGPGVVGGKLVGVVSFGAPNCGAPDAPTVFTKLGYYTDWIEGILEMETPSGGRSTTLRPTMQIYDGDNFVISTKKTFKVTPIIASPRSTSPIPSSDALRSLNENEMFKEFITTMFGSEEVKEYLDQFESEETLTETTKRDIVRAAIVRPTTEPTTEADIEDTPADYDFPDDQKGSVRMVTTIDNFDELQVDELQAQSEETEDTTPTPEASLQIEDNDEQVQMEQNIAKLIDNIDIQELLASDIEEESYEPKNVIPKEINKPKEAKRYKETELSKPQNEILEKQESEEESDDSTVEIEIFENEETANADGGNNGDVYAGIGDQSNIISEELELPSPTKEVKKIKKEKKKKESYKDATFRQNSTDGILDIFSRNDLLKLFHEAVVDAASQNAISYTTSSTTEDQPTRGFFDRRDNGLSIPA